jgi:hypothetical protein
MVAYWDGSALAGEMCPDCTSDVMPLTTPHRTALALQRIVSGLADLSLAVSDVQTSDEAFTLWSQFTPLVETSVALQDRMASKVDRQLKENR